MATMSELYQGVILDHNRAPRNYRVMEDASCHADGFNPSCGDRVTVWARLGDDGRIEDVSFQGEGCAISRASASLMTTAVKGRTREEALGLFDRFHELVTGTGGADALGKLAVFGGVSAFPMRVKCASLSWHALRSALEAADDQTGTPTR
jgi:nitrogen fixation protein NifU and related proteins